jgi:hypothetical protein
MVAPEIIGWKGFFRALEMQPGQLLEASLSRWYFSDGGVSKRLDCTQANNEAIQKLQNSVIAAKRAKCKGGSH